MFKQIVFIISILIALSSKAQDKFISFLKHSAVQSNTDYRGIAFDMKDFVDLKLWSTNQEIKAPSDTLIAHVIFNKKRAINIAQQKGANIVDSTSHYYFDINQTNIVFKIISPIKSVLKGTNNQAAFKIYSFNIETNDFISKKKINSLDEALLEFNKADLSFSTIQYIKWDYPNIPSERDSVFIETEFWKNGLLKSQKIYSGTFYYDGETYHNNGEKHFQLDNKDVNGFDGIINVWDTNGDQIAKDGNGKYISYYVDGMIKSQGFLKNYKEDSLWITYYHNGNIKSIGKYFTVEYNQGKTGKWQFYYRNGNLKSEGIYNFHKAGDWTFYHENGQKKSIQNGSFFFDREFTKEAWDINGKQTCKNGNGFLYSYYPNQEIKSKIVIKESKQDSGYHYFSNGQLHRISHHNLSTKNIHIWDSLGNQILDNRTGWDFEFDEHGKVLSKTHLIKGIRNGKGYEFYPDGIVKKVIVWKNDNWIHSCEYFSSGVKFEERFNTDSVKTRLKYRTFYFNGNLKKEIYVDKTVLFHPNAQPKAFGQQPKDFFKRIGYLPDDKSDSVKDFMMNDYFLMMETTYDDHGSFSFNPYQWKKTWYSNGQIETEVIADSIKSELTFYQYFKSGKLKAKGIIKYDDFDISYDKTDDNYGFIGYLKVGEWSFYNEIEKVVSIINMDKEPLKIRKLNFRRFED